jgi:translation initiation factor IF-1
MDPEKSDFDAKAFHQQFQKKKGEKKSTKHDGIKAYKITYDGQLLEFDASKSLGILEVSEGPYPIMIRPEVLDSENWNAHEDSAKKALESKKTASAKAENGIKIIKHLSGKYKGRDWKIDSKEMVAVELKVFGEKESGGVGENAWDWRAIGVRDDDQKCVFLLEELQSVHTGERLSKACEEMVKKVLKELAPKNAVENPGATTLEKNPKQKTK